MKFQSLSIAVFAAALGVASIAPASAQERYWHHRHHCCNTPFGLVGAVVVGAATIATLPFVALDDAFSGPRYDHRQRYYGTPYEYNGPPPSPRAQDQNGYRGQAYGDPRGYADRGGYYDDYPPQSYPPPGYRPAPSQYDGRGDDDGPPPGY